jgi:hypothetical protein
MSLQSPLDIASPNLSHRIQWSADGVTKRGAVNSPMVTASQQLSFEVGGSSAGRVTSPRLSDFGRARAAIESCSTFVFATSVQLIRSELASRMGPRYNPKHYIGRGGSR